MAKTTNKRTTYKCGKCGETGHNARTCTGGKSSTSTEQVSDSSSAVIEKPTPPTVALSTTEDLTAIRRLSKESRPVNVPSPFTCPTCQRVGILVLIETPEGNRQLRCEYCQNKTPVKIIHKWGAVPGDKPR